MELVCERKRSWFTQQRCEEIPSVVIIIEQAVMRLDKIGSYREKAIEINTCNVCKDCKISMTQ